MGPLSILFCTNQSWFRDSMARAGVLQTTTRREPDTGPFGWATVLPYWPLVADNAEPRYLRIADYAAWPGRGGPSKTLKEGHEIAFPADRGPQEGGCTRALLVPDNHSKEGHTKRSSLMTPLGPALVVAKSLARVMWRMENLSSQPAALGGGGAVGLSLIVRLAAIHHAPTSAPSGQQYPPHRHSPSCTLTLYAVYCATPVTPHGRWRRRCGRPNRASTSTPGGTYPPYRRSPSSTSKPRVAHPHGPSAIVIVDDTRRVRRSDGVLPHR